MNPRIINQHTSHQQKPITSPSFVSNTNTEHWKLFLKDLDNKTLFTAARFTDGPTPPSFIPPLKDSEGRLTSIPEEQADLLFHGPSAPTIGIDLSDVDAAPSRPRSSLPFATAEAIEVIDGLKPSKSPGPDKIPSRVLKLGGNILAQCIVRIANLCLDLGHFPSPWKVAKSVILKKVGKPDYSNRSAY